MSCVTTGIKDHESGHLPKCPTHSEAKKTPEKQLWELWPWKDLTPAIQTTTIKKNKNAYTPAKDPGQFLEEHVLLSEQNGCD